MPRTPRLHTANANERRHRRAVRRRAARAAAGPAAIRDAGSGLPDRLSDLHADVGEPIVSSNRAAQARKVTETNDGELFGIPPTGKNATTYGCGTVEFGEDGLLQRAVFPERVKEPRTETGLRVSQCTTRRDKMATGTLKRFSDDKVRVHQAR
jgi:hypothetical protein